MNGWRKASSSHANGQCTEISAWRKPRLSFSNGNCAEIGVLAPDKFRNSSFCQTKECVGIDSSSTFVGVRDTKQAHLGESRTVLEFTSAVWREFIQRVKSE